MGIELTANEKENRKKARKILKKYRRLQRIAGRSDIDLRSPIITDMPRCNSVKNRSNDSVIEKLDAQAERQLIDRALACLSYKSRVILFWSFCDVEDWTNYKIGLELGYSDKSIEKYKSRALAEFLEAFYGVTSKLQKK